MRRLTIATKSGVFSVVETLLDFCADPETQEGPHNASGTPPNRAIDYGQVAIVRLLLRRGANPKVLDAYNGTIVHNAAMNGQDEILKILFEKSIGVDINAQGTNGRTASHDAAYFGYCSTRILFANGAPERSPLGVAKDMSNLSALSLLTELGKQEIARDESRGSLLKHNSSSINSSNDMSLLTAARLGMAEIIQSYFIRAQTDPIVDLNTVDLDRRSKSPTLLSFASLLQPRASTPISLTIYSALLCTGPLSMATMRPPSACSTPVQM